MALTNETTSFGGGNSQILTIVGGTFTMRCDENTEGAVPRALTKGVNEGTIVHEVHYNSLTAIIQKGTLDSGQFGLNGQLEMVDPDTGEEYTVQLPGDSDIFRDFMKRLPNINLDELVSLELIDHRSKVNKAGNPIKVLQVVQNGNRINDYFTEWKKENGKNVPHALHGMPDWENTRKGWDSTKQDEFLYEWFEKVFSGEPIKGESVPVEDQCIEDVALDDNDDPLPY